MHNRTTYPSQPSFRNYGARGIAVCKAWQTFESFRDWALKNGYQDDLTIDRINNNGDYTPSNCQWITLGQNIANRNKEAGKRLRLKKAAKRSRINTGSGS